MVSGAWRQNHWRWEIAEPYDGAAELGRQLKSSTLIAQILHNRGIGEPDQAREFLAPKLTSLHDPETLAGATDAAERITRAVNQGEKITIYGDYDVDGITGVSILYSLLKVVGADVDFYVPHRLDEGYGVNEDAVDLLISQGTKLIVTVDCGISAIKPLERAGQAGVDVIITDHHSPGEVLPDVLAIVHPSLPGKEYACPNLAGAGVAFKLAWQVARAICGSTRVSEDMRKFLVDAMGLAALGTIADMVPLIGENRVLATYGLRGLSASNHPGLSALLASAKLSDEKLDAFHVGFVLAPRLNACGRMGHAQQAIEMLTDASVTRCREIAEHLAEKNTERQGVERQITEHAISMVEERGFDDPATRAIVLGSDQWHGGVIGIVASRLVGRYHRPTVLVAFDGDSGQGSGRSIQGFHMRDALAASSDNLLGFGGHAMAGGLKIETPKFDAFAEDFARYASENLTDEQLQPSLRIDAETTFASLTQNTVYTLSRLGPFGQGNPAPVIAVRNCKVLSPPRRMGRKGQTIGLQLQQGGVSLRAVGFGMGDLADALVGINTVDLACEPMLNTFNGRTSVELKIRDMQWQ